MAKCTGCGKRGSRIRSRWNDDGRLPDICPACSPTSFEKFTAPTDKKIWMGFEAHPNQYEKKYDKDGLIYERKPEYRHEQEQKLMQATEEEQEAQSKAVRKKRATRRTQKMSPTEELMALAKARQLAQWVEESGQNVC